jgi:hypothetical protein
MWAVWPRILSDGETPVELIESAGWFPFRVAEVDANLFTRSEWKERYCPSTYPQPFKIRVGSDPIKPADASLMLS